MNALIREVATEVHPFEVAFFRNFFGLVIMVPVVMRAGSGAFRTSKVGLHIVRSVLNSTAMLTHFTALSMTALATATALGFTAPLFASFLAAVMLRERVGPRRIMALVVGFAGTLVVLRPGFVQIQLGEVLLIISALIWGLTLVDIKVLSRTESSTTMTLYATLLLTPITLLVAIPFWTWPSGYALMLLFAIGACGTFNQMAVAQAFHEADASQVLPADFTKLIWASLIGYIVFAERPDFWTLLGGTLIFGAVAYVAIREAQLAHRGRQAAAKLSSTAPGRP